MKKVIAKVVSRRLFDGGYLRLQFESDEIAHAAKPGQFVNILTNPSLKPYLRRPISIEDVDNDKKTVSLLIKVVGPGTQSLESAQVGDQLDILGPLGNGFDMDSLAPNTLLVAGGIGVAPFLYLSRTVAGGSKEIFLHLYAGGASKADLPSWDDFHGLTATRKAATEDGSFGKKGLVTDVLKNDLGKFDPKQTTIFCCGPTPMMKAVFDIAIGCGIPCFVSLETTMGCGIGSCLGCVAQIKDQDDAIDHLRVCKDGPVFDASRLTWEGMR